MVTLHKSVHGVPVVFSTDSELIAAPVRKFLEYFTPQIEMHSRPMIVQFHEVSSRNEIPWQEPSHGHTLFSQQWRTPTFREEHRIEWKCRILRDKHRLIADFHEKGLFIIDEDKESAAGYIVQPATLHCDLRRRVFSFCLVRAS